MQLAKPFPASAAAVLVFIGISAAGISNQLSAQAENHLALQKGDRIVFIGNTFAERSSLFSYLETILTAGFPDYQLRFRNLGWSADTLTLQPRPLDFGDLYTHLEDHKADVIFACFGMNEAFEGDESLAKFEEEWHNLLDELQARRFNGRSPPRIVLVSPIYHEPMGGHLPDPTLHNRYLKLFTEAMSRLAAQRNLPFVDLFSPTQRLMSAVDAERLTFNGLHLTRYGYWVVDQILARSLGFLPESMSQMVQVNPEATDAPPRFRMDQYRPVPPPPRGVRIHPEIETRLPLVRISGLEPGRYLLKSGDAILAAAGHNQWKEGVRLRLEPHLYELERLRETIIEKNQQFFYRWRAVNGEYIYGRRMYPFGVEDFPGMLARIDQLIVDLEKEIWRQSQALGAPEFELRPQP